MHADETDTTEPITRGHDHRWIAPIVSAMAVGLLIGFVLREFVGSSYSFISVSAGLIATVAGVGTSNVFAKPGTKPYNNTVQRVAAILAVVALGMSLPGIWGV